MQSVSGVINSNTVLPILEDFLFEIENNKLLIVATDLESVMKTELAIESKENGKVCIPAKILLDSLKNIGLLKQPRLSVIKLTKEEFEIIVNMNNI